MEHEYEYEIGELVQLACQKGSGINTRSDWDKAPAPYDYATHNPEPKYIEWVDAIIRKRCHKDSLYLYMVVGTSSENCRWYVEVTVVKTHLRKYTTTETVVDVPMATSCLECKTQFTYPVEYNHAQGRLCYSCKSTYGWKY